MLPKKQGALLVALAAFLFGTEAIFAKLGYNAGVNLITTLTVRFVLSAAIFSLMTALAGLSFRVPKKALGLFGFLIILYLGIAASLYQAFALLPASLAIMFFYAYPALTGILAFLITREKINLTRSLALLISGCGLILLLWSSFENISMTGVLVALTAALLNALYLIFVPKMLDQVHQLTFLSWIFVTSAIFYTSLGVFSGTISFQFSLSGWFFLMSLSLIATAAATMAQIYGLRLTGPVLTGIIFTLEPPVTAILAFLIFGETLKGWQLVGVALILLAVLLPQIKIANGKHPASNK